MADEELRLTNAESIVSLITGPERDRNSESEVWLLLKTYCFHVLVRSKKMVSQTIMIQETSVLEPRFSPAPPSTKHHINQVGNPAGAKKWNQYCTKSPKSSISTTQTNHCQRPTWQREQGKKKTQGHAGTRFPLLSPSRSSSSSARHTCTDCANCLWGHWREQLATC